MFFDELITTHQRLIEAFIAEPALPLMILRTDPDLEMVAARMIALWNQDKDPEGEEIAFGLSAPFVDAEQFFGAVEAQLIEVIDELAAAFAEAGEELVLPKAMARGRAHPQTRVEVLFAELLEGLARGLGGFHDRVLIAIRFDEIVAIDACVESLARLSQAIRYPGLKIFVLDSRIEPRLPALELQRARLILDDFSPRTRDMGGALRKVIEHDRQRVVGLRLPIDQVEVLWQLLWDINKRLGVPLRAFYLEAEFRNRLQFADLIYKRLVSGQRPPPDWAGDGLVHSDVIPELKRKPIEKLPPDLYDERAVILPEATFTAAIDQALEALGDTHVCLVLRPHRTGELSEWQTFVTQLAACSVSARVTWIVLDVDASAELPAPQVDRFRWIEHEFTMGAPQLEASLEKSLKLPDLPPPLRIQGLLMLGGMWAAKGRLDEGVQLLAEGVDLSADQGSPDQQSASWWSLGNALQRGGALTPARNAYAEALEIAIDADNPVAAANALMSLGHTWFIEREWGQALENYQVARTYWQKVGQTFGVCNASIWMAEAYRHGQHPAEAERLLLEVEATYRAMRAPFEDMAKQGVAETHERMAMLYEQIGQLDKATHYHRSARQLGCEGVPELPA
ncbi:tetratricopeptide repeat protein [Nannocystaceae bacterium ST9]